MTTTIRDINELQDRRIMMEKKLPPFGYALILLTAALILFLVVWSTKNYRTYVSQSSGSVQAANKTYIMSSYSGSITELNIAEGSYVNEGDLIAHIKSTDLDMQQDSLQSQLDIYKKQKSQYEKLVKSIQDDKNYFSETDIDDQPYYYQYETYKSQVAQKAFDASPYQAAGYSDEQIKALMEQNQSEVEALYYSTLQSISASLTSVQSNIDNLQSQMDALNTGANDYYIYAPPPASSTWTRPIRWAWCSAPAPRWPPSPARTATSRWWLTSPSTTDRCSMWATPARSPSPACRSIPTAP